MFDQSVAWLRRHRVLLPGVRVLERLVAHVREATDDRCHAVVASQVDRADPRLAVVLGQLPVVLPGKRWSQLEQLRRSPTRTSGVELARALQRAEDLSAYRLGRVQVDKVPVRRMKTLARYGAGSKAPTLAKLLEPRKTATLLAVTRSLEATAIDDALDLFNLPMATKLISPARRKSETERLAMLPKLEKASKLVARAERVLVQQLDLVAECNADLDPAAVWVAIADQTGATRDQVLAALAEVEELVPEDEDAADAAHRAALADKWGTVRPFLRLLGESKALRAAPGGVRLLAAVRKLPELARRQVGRKPLAPAEIDQHLVPRVWKRAVYDNPELPKGAVDRDAYAVCLLMHLHKALQGPAHRTGRTIRQFFTGSAQSVTTKNAYASLTFTTFARRSPRALCRASSQ